MILGVFERGVFGLNLYEILFIFKISLFILENTKTLGFSILIVIANVVNLKIVVKINSKFINIFFIEFS